MATAAYNLRRPATGAAPQRSARRFYAPELDALRFVAFLLVFCRHVTNALGSAKLRIDAGAATGAAMARTAASGPAITVAAGHPAAPSFLWSTIQGALQSLDFGVCLFFFLSSFLITRLLLIEKNSTGKIAVRDFYIRRSLRIWPLYFSFLALIAILSQFFPVLHVSMTRFLAAVFFVANWAAVLHGWNSIAIQPLWSVSVEEQFYMVWPNFARRGRPAIIAGSVVLAIASLGTLFYFGHAHGTQMTQVWPNTLVQCLFLSGGALTACLSSPEVRRLHAGARLALLGCGFTCWVVAGAGFHVVRTESPGAFALVAGYLLVLGGTFFIFSGVAGWNGRPVPKWLLYLGKISYGLYVFHVACMMLSEQAMGYAFGRLHMAHTSPYVVEGMSALLALALTMACAMLSYTYLEGPFLRLKNRFTVVPSRPV